MSNYYQINGLKVRVSNHEPNTALRGSSDIYIWTNDACGTTLSIGGQIQRICEKRGFEEKDFEAIIRDFATTDEECMYMLMEIEGKI